VKYSLSTQKSSLIGWNPISSVYWHDDLLKGLLNLLRIRVGFETMVAPGSVPARTLRIGCLVSKEEQSLFFPVRLGAAFRGGVHLPSKVSALKHIAIVAVMSS
jgi:hypothetical protein